MANTKHYNNIKIARGTRAAWLEKAQPSYGEMFYDKNTRGVYIAAPNAEAEGGIELKRFGGFDSIVLKGTIDSENFGRICNTAEPGDAYIVTGRISVIQPEIIFDNDGNVVRDKTSTRVYDDFFKNGQVIIFTSENVEYIPNSYSLPDAGSSEGAKGIITLAGTSEAVDLEYDPSLAEAANDVKITDVQTALDTLFNEKMEYIGSFNEADVTSTDGLEEGDNYTPATKFDKVWAIIAKKRQLLMGQSIVYSGPTKNVETVDGDVTIRTNTLIVNNAGTIYTIPLGSSDARDNAYSPAGSLKTDETIPHFETVNANGERVDDLSYDQISTVQHALDYLTQNKADLNSQGKLPLSQMPSTLIGALQYVGTVTIADATTTLKASELAALMRTAKEGGDSWEKDTDVKEGNEKANAYENLDSGDYTIISIPLASVQGEDHQLSRQVVITDDATGEELFKVSNGDHVIINSASEDGYVFDHLDSSAAVDSVNGILGSVEIVDKERNITKSFAADGTTTEVEVQETKVETDPATHSIRVLSPNAVLENEALPSHNIPQAAPGKSLVASDLFVNDTKHSSKYKPEGEEHNTEIVGKKADGTDVVVELPNKSGMLQVIGEGDGTKDVVPKFDENGALIDSAISQFEDPTSGKRTVRLGENFDINFDNLSELFKYVKDKSTVTRLFDHDDDNINSESSNGRYHDEFIRVVLDEDSAIDGGEWE